MLSPLTVIFRSASGLAAGPFVTEPSLALNLLPWHGQTISLFETLATGQP